MTAPLMPRATAVWLVENTTLTFRQISIFCEIHELEIQAIADGDVSGNIRGLSPIDNGQLTWEEIRRCEADNKANMEANQLERNVKVLNAKAKKILSPSQRQDKPSAILWVIKNYPTLKHGQICKLIGTTKSTIETIRTNAHKDNALLRPKNPVTIGLCTEADIEKALKASEPKPVKEKKIKVKKAKKTAPKKVAKKATTPAAKKQAKTKKAAAPKKASVKKAAIKKGGTKMTATKKPAAKKEPAVKKPAVAKKAPAKKPTAVKKPAVAKAAPAKKPAVKKAPVKKAAPAKKPAVKKAPVKKAAPAKKPAVKKAPVKKAPVKKAPVKKAAPAKKPAVKKAPVKKAAPKKVAPKAKK